MSLNPDFNLNCIVTGTVVSIVKETEERTIDGKKIEAQPAQLQFITQTPRKLDFINVKVLGSKEKDLEKFLNKKVKIENVQISKMGFDSYYRIDDISLISLLDEKKV